MPDTEKKARPGKHAIPIPKPDTASDDALRDESTQYGDEAEIPQRRRKRTDARVPIIKNRKAKEEACQEAQDLPLAV